jgi:GNAT superfamily N-acetyltransferase
MPVRFANLNDVPGAVELGRRMHALTRFADIPFVPQKVEQSLQSLLTEGKGKYVFLVAEDGAAQIVGGLIGVLERHLFTEEVTASVMHYDVLPEARMGGYGVRLLRAFEGWAAKRKVVEISLGVNSGGDWQRVGQFVTRMGYAKVGENFVKGVKA